MDSGRVLSNRTNAFLSEYFDAQGGPEGAVWHYTSESSACSILSSRRLRASSVFHQADPREIIHGHEQIVARLEAAVGDTRLSRILRSVCRTIREQRRNMPRQYLTFCASFSEVRDDPSQWRHYGQGRGVALAFELNPVIKVNLGMFHIEPYKCVYDTLRQQELIDRFISWVTEAGFESSVSVEEAVFVADLMATGFKCDEFARENEWRLACWVKSPEDVEFPKEGDGPRIPYISLTLECMADEQGLKEVMVGPPPGRDLEQLYSAAQQAGIERDSVTGSSLLKAAPRLLAPDDRR